MLRFGYHVHRSYAPHGRGDFIMPIYPSVENDNQVIEPNKDIPLEMMVENYYKKKIGAEMSEETKSVLMDILREDKEDK